MHRRNEQDFSRRPLFKRLVAWAFATALVLSCGLPRAHSDDFRRSTPEQRRERLKKLDAAQKEKLARQKERFDQLPPEEQDRLRALDQALAESPDGDRLFGVLQRYCEWLKTLTPAQRAELSALSDDAKVAHIRELMKEQEKQRVQRLANLSYEEGQTLLAWLDPLIKPHQETLFNAIKSERHREIVRDQDDPQDRRRKIVFFLLWERQHERLKEVVQPSPADIDRLVNQLNPETRIAFQRLNDDDQQQDLVRHWIFGVVFSPLYIPVAENELHKHFADLPANRQAELERLPREEMMQELRRSYFESQLNRRGWGRGDRRPPLGRPSFSSPYRGNRDRSDDAGPSNGDRKHGDDRDRPSAGNEDPDNKAPGNEDQDESKQR